MKKFKQVKEICENPPDPLYPRSNYVADKADLTDIRGFF